MANIRGYRGRTSRPRRSVTWQFGPQAVNLAFAATGAQIWTVGLLSGLEVTIMRIRGHAAAYLLTQGSGGDGYAGAIGIGVATEQAFLAGSGSLPSPVTETEWDGWMYHRYFDVRGITGTEADGSNAVSVVERWEIDSKAMRKFGEQYVLFGAIEATEIGTSTMDFHADTRVLLKQ